MENLTLTSEGGYALSLAVAEHPETRAVVQIIHGMEEHKERYYSWMEELAGHGLTAVVSDLRGHGSSAPRLSHIADRDGDALLIRDQQTITRWIQDRFPGVPVLLFGHSMGSIITRVLLQTDSRRYAGVALSGYVCPNPAAPVAVALGSCIRLVKGSAARSPLLDKLALGAYSRSIPDRKTDLDWLSFNAENVRTYQADPLCGQPFTTGSYLALFRLLNRMGRPGDYRDVAPDLPLLLIAGQDDPCAGWEKGRESSRRVLTEAGFRKISVVTLEHMRHEILQETDPLPAKQALLDFFLAAVKA